MEGTHHACQWRVVCPILQYAPVAKFPPVLKRKITRLGRDPSREIVALNLTVIFARTHSCPLSQPTSSQYVLYFPKDKKYLQLEKGKEGPPRAQRSHARFLKEALARGEAAGWTEFQHNLDKFVNGRGKEGGRPKAAAQAADLSGLML